MTSPAEPLANASPRDVPRTIASARPDAPALIGGGRTVTYSELDALSNRAAHAIQSLGLPDRSVISIMAGNSIGYVPVHFGAARTSHVLAHLSHRFTPKELEYALKLTGTRAFIGDGHAWPVYAEALPELESRPRLLSMGSGAPSDADDFASLMAGRPETDPGIPVGAADPITILFTSGTTGLPKAAVASHRARIIASTAAAEDHPIAPDDVCAVTIPLCHAAGLYSWFTPIMVAGACAVILEHWDPVKFMEAAENHGLTTAFVVPTQMAMLFDHPDFDPNRVSTLRQFIYGGAAATEELLARAESALPGVRIVQAFGSTESSHVLSQQPEERALKPGTLGKPGPRIEVGVFTAPGVPAKPGEEGELCTRGGHLFDRYIGSDEDTKAYFKSGDGWGWTGDLAVMDEDGVVTLIGRTKEVIISGGMNISPVELENSIEDHPAVAACAAFGMADEKWGELPAAAVVLRDGVEATEDDILGHGADRIASFKRLRRIVFVDALPLTASGKIKRAQVKEDLAPLLAKEALASK